MVDFVLSKLLLYGFHLVRAVSKKILLKKFNALLLLILLLSKNFAPHAKCTVLLIETIE